MNEVMKKEERAVPTYRPATDILEREDGFYIYMDMPGVDRQQLEIDLNGDELTVSAVTSMQLGENEHFSEMQFGNCEYRRVVSLSDIVDRERIKANLSDGVLELHLPKVERIQPRRIEITKG